MGQNGRERNDLHWAGSPPGPGPHAPLPLAWILVTRTRPACITALPVHTWYVYTSHTGTGTGVWHTPATIVDHPLHYSCRDILLFCSLTDVVTFNTDSCSFSWGCNAMSHELRPKRLNVIVSPTSNSASSHSLHYIKMLSSPAPSQWHSPAPNADAVRGPAPAPPASSGRPHRLSELPDRRGRMSGSSGSWCNNGHSSVLTSARDASHHIQAGARRQSGVQTPPVRSKSLEHARRIIVRSAKAGACPALFSNSTVQRPCPHLHVNQVSIGTQ